MRVSTAPLQSKSQYHHLRRPVGGLNEVRALARRAPPFVPACAQRAHRFKQWRDGGGWRASCSIVLAFLAAGVTDALQARGEPVVARRRAGPARAHRRAVLARSAGDGGCVLFSDDHLECQTETSTTEGLLCVLDERFTTVG